MPGSRYAVKSLEEKLAAEPSVVHQLARGWAGKGWCGHGNSNERKSRDDKFVHGVISFGFKI
jgi:hypothetical protein